MEKRDNAWYVLSTKPRNEKKVAERLAAAGFTVYCPLQKVRRQWSDRIQTIEEPLFKRYIFIYIENFKRHKVFEFPGTLRYLFWLGQPAIVRSEEITTIQKWLGNYNHEDINISAIEPGNFVRITSGHFEGEEAVFIDVRNNKAVLQLKEMGIQLSLLLSQNDLLAIK